MLKFSCPSCGAEIVFKSTASIYGICSYCKSTTVRHDLNLELYGKMSDLKEDLSPFCLGTKGFYKQQHFELIGRLRLKWENGFWNEWFVLLPNGLEAWLAEAMGFYMFSRPSNASNLPFASEVKIGEKYKFQNTIFQVEDIKEATCIGSEGELPFLAPVGRTITSIDLSSADGLSFANLEYEQASAQLTTKLTAKRLYLGEYLNFDDFNFSNLREIEGWRYDH